MLWKELLLLLAVVSQETKAYSCTNYEVVVKYQGFPYYFPAQGTDDHFDPGTMCDFEIQIPDGYYAIIGTHADLGVETGNFDNWAQFNLECDYLSAGKECRAEVCDAQAPAACPKVSVDLTTFQGKEGTFRFNVTWMKAAPQNDPVITTLTNYSYTFLDPSVMNTDNVQTFQINSQSQLQTYMSCLDILNQANVWVYGSYENNLGDHSSLFFGQATSVNSLLTLYNPVRDAPLSDCVVLAADKRYDDHFSGYHIAYSPASNPQLVSLSVSSMDSEMNPTAVTIYTPDNQPFTLYSVLFWKGKSNVLAYCGLPTPTELVLPDVIFTFDTVDSQMPYTFNCSVVTITIYDGLVWLNSAVSIDTNSVNATQNKDLVGSKLRATRKQ